jgi:glyoxylate reductase
MNGNVYVTRRIPDPGIEFLKARCGTMDVNPLDRALSRPELAGAAAGRDGLLSMVTDRIDGDLLESCGSIRIVSNFGVGFNNIDVEAATRLGVMVTNTPGVLTDATADLAWALIFAVSRRIVEADRYLRAGRFTEWQPMLLLGADLAGRTLGVVGAGRIGTAVALRSVGFRMRVLYCDRSDNSELESIAGGRRVPIENLLAESDIVSLHVPLDSGTRHLIGDAGLNLMKPSAVLINTSRGPVVDEKALVRALRAGRIAGAGLDVYENEPVVEPELLGMDNVVLLPHIGSATTETRGRMSLLAAQNLAEGLAGGLPPNLVNPDVIPRLRKA